MNFFFSIVQLEGKVYNTFVPLSLTVFLNIKKKEKLRSRICRISKCNWHVFAVGSTRTPRVIPLTRRGKISFGTGISTRHITIQ